MKRRTLAAAGLGAMLAAAGCGPTEPPKPEPGRLTRRLNSFKDAYYEYEPLRLALVLSNPTAEPVQAAPAARGTYLLIHRIEDNDEVSWRPIPVVHQPAAGVLEGGQLVDVHLRPAGEGAWLSGPGVWVVNYQHYLETISGRRKLLHSCQTIVRCLRQPLNLPPGTDGQVAGLMSQLAAAPAHQYDAHFPSWTKVTYNEPMRGLLALGARAVPALMANLDHYRIRPAVIQLLADMKHRPAVPRLLEMLQLADSVRDRLILTALARITEHPQGFEFYRRWAQIETKEAALGAYRAWAAGSRP